MKKFLAIAALAAIFASCEDKKADETKTDTMVTENTVVTPAPDTMTPMPADTNSMMSADTMNKMK